MKYVLGIDIGGTTIKSSFVSENGELVGKFVLPVKKGAPQEETLNDLIELVQKNWTLNNDDILGIGIGCPGGINPKKGTCDYATNLGWRDFNLTVPFKNIFHKPAYIDNDANAALLGEVHFGIAREYKNVVFLTLGTGVGSGLYLDGRIYSGNEGKGAELGHVTIDANGRSCACGRKGCLETYASATALCHDAAMAMVNHPESLMWNICKSPNNMTGVVVFQAEKMGDPAAKQVVEEYISHLGQGCLNICNALRPEAIILGGGVSKQGTNLTSRLQKYLAMNGYGLLKERAPKTDVLVSSLGSDAGIYGAAAICFEQFKTNA